VPLLPPFAGEMLWPQTHPRMAAERAWRLKSPGSHDLRIVREPPERPRRGRLKEARDIVVENPLPAVGNCRKPRARTATRPAAPCTAGGSDLFLCQAYRYGNNNSPAESIPGNHPRPPSPCLRKLPVRGFAGDFPSATGGPSVVAASLDCGVTGLRRPAVQREPSGWGAAGRTKSQGRCTLWDAPALVTPDDGRAGT
jgi:hypothetical protein